MEATRESRSLPDAWVNVLIGTLSVAFVTEYLVGLPFRHAGMPLTAWGLTVVLTLRESAALAALLLLARHRLGLTVNDFGFRRPRLADLGVAVAATCIAILVFGPLSRLFPHAGHSQIAVAMYRGTFVSRLALTLNVGLYSPIVQEMLFRGLVLTALLQRTSPRVAIIVSACLFAAIHLPDPALAVNALLLGTLQGWLFVRFRSLWIPIVSHVMVNGYSMIWLLVYYTSRGR